MREQTKDFYTVAEIITGLRSDYAALRTNLLELQKLLVVAADKNVSTSLYFYSMVDCQHPNLQGVFAKIQKSSKLDEVWQKYLTRYFYHDMLKEAALYHLKEINGGLIFIDETEGFVRHDYIEKIGFSDFSAASQAYSNLRKVPFYEIPSVRVILNVYQSLLIDGSFIYFDNEDSRNGAIDIIYDALTDEIKINSSTKCYPYFLERLLETEVYRGQIPEKLRTLIDNSGEKQSKIAVEDRIKYRKENFTFGRDYQKRLALVKKNN